MGPPAPLLHAMCAWIVRPSSCACIWTAHQVQETGRQCLRSGGIRDDSLDPVPQKPHMVQAVMNGKRNVCVRVVTSPCLPVSAHLRQAPAAMQAACSPARRPGWLCSQCGGRRCLPLCHRPSLPAAASPAFAAVRAWSIPPDSWRIPPDRSQISTPAVTARLASYQPLRARKWCEAYPSTMLQDECITLVVIKGLRHRR